MSGRKFTRPVCSARRSAMRLTGLAETGHPYPEQNPQLLHTGLPLYSTELAAIGKKKGCSPTRLAPAASSMDERMLRPGRHRVGLFLRLVLLYDGGYRPDIALNPDQVLDLVVVRRDVAVFERPVRHVRPGHRAEQRQSLEVDVPQPGALGIRVWECAADLVGKVVDVADERLCGVLAGVLAKCAREGDGVRLLEVAVPT